MQEPIDRPARWERLRAVAPLLAVAIIAGAGNLLVSAASYQHEYELARHNEQAPWVSGIDPFTIDGVIFVAGIALMWAMMNGVRGWRRLWQPLCVLAVGVLATIAANCFSDLRFWWLGPVVSGWTGVSLVLMSAVAFWLPAEQRKLAKGDTSQPVAACSCPPPPVSLAEALPLARARLVDLGEPSGEEALADRFGVTRHKVRAVLVPAVKNPPAGAGISDPYRSPAGAKEPPVAHAAGDGARVVTPGAAPSGYTPVPDGALDRGRGGPYAPSSAVPATQSMNGHGGAGG